MDGFPIGGTLAEPGHYPARRCNRAERTPQQLLRNAKWRLKAGLVGLNSPREPQLWGEALDRVKRVWLDGPVPHSGEGKLLTGTGRQLTNPAFRLSVEQGLKLRPVADLKRCQATKADAVRAQRNLPQRDPVAAVIRTFREAPLGRSLAMATADREEVYGQIPMVAVVPWGPASAEMRGVVPHIHLVGAIAAVLHYGAVSRTMASFAP